MKNLNRKLSVIALSGMAVFGGVAVSGVQAFAAQPEVKVEQQQEQDKAVAEVQKMIEDLHFENIYKAVKSGDRKVLIQEAVDKYAGSKFFQRGSIKLNPNKPQKSLDRILGRRNRAIVVGLNGNYVLIEEIVNR